MSPPLLIIAFHWAFGLFRFIQIPEIHMILVGMIEKIKTFQLKPVCSIASDWIVIYYDIHSSDTALQLMLGLVLYLNFRIQVFLFTQLDLLICVFENFDVPSKIVWLTVIVSITCLHIVLLLYFSIRLNTCNDLYEQIFSLSISLFFLFDFLYRVNFLAQTIWII